MYQSSDIPTVVLTDVEASTDPSATLFRALNRKLKEDRVSIGSVRCLDTELAEGIAVVGTLFGAVVMVNVKTQKDKTHLEED